MRIWHWILFKFHYRISEWLKKDGAFQTTRFMTHRNKMHYHEKWLRK